METVQQTTIIKPSSYVNQKDFNLAFIGDVHGCIDEVFELVSKINPWGNNTLLVFTGDLIDKGSADYLVLEYTYELYKQGVADFILGNHDLKFLRWLDQIDLDLPDSQRVKPPKKSDFQRIVDKSPQVLNWFKNIPSFAFKFDKYIGVHAGISPVFQRHCSIGLGHQTRYSDLSSITKKQRDLIKSLTYTRYVNPKGYSVSLGDETENDIFWAQSFVPVPLYKPTTAVFGHQIFDEVTFFPNAIGIDTGCVYGNKLSAWIVNTETGENYIESVKAKKVYSEKDV